MDERLSAAVLARRSPARRVLRAVFCPPCHAWARGSPGLRGVPAGVRGPDGKYPEGTVLGRCAARLADMAEQLRQYREI